MANKAPYLLDLDKSSAENLIPAPQPKTNPGDPLGEDWLKALEVGTYFVSEINTSRTASNKYIMDEFCVLAHTKTTWLHYANSNQRLRVNSLKFSRQNHLVEVLGVVSMESNNEPEHNRADNPEGLDDVEKPA